MIKNVKVKNILSNTVFALISKLNIIVPKDDRRVLLYSNSDFRDNLQYLYQYCIDMGYNEKYKIIRSYQGSKETALPKNVKDVSNIKAIWEYMRSGHVYYAFGKLPIFPTKNQCVIQMWHGSPFKGMDKGVETARHANPYYTYYLAASDFFRPAVYEAYACDDEHVAICGNPRNDVMYEDNQKYDLGVQGENIVIWMPTFRKSNIVGYADVDQKTLVPFFTNEELVSLDQKLKEWNIGLVIKIHPSQDLELLKDTHFNNICILSHQMFVGKGFDLYRLLSQTDALITDYSSVFYDYMLLDKPVAFTMEDFEEYKANRGFIVDDPEYLMAGYKIYRKEDLYSFFDDVSDGIDIWKKNRNEINDLVNQYQDGQNRRRALEISNITIP